jgi:MoxR-like ATPase
MSDADAPPNEAKYPFFRKGLKDAAENPEDDFRWGSPAATEIAGTATDAQDDPAGYLISEPLNRAINVALLLGRPLLLTGEPGTGKTELGAAIAHELRCPPPYVFETKSTSLARDLFYTFDVLGRYAAREAGAAQTRQGVAASDPLLFVQYHALGKAILNAFPRDKVSSFLLPPGVASSFVHAGPQRSVVVIDEIDKAPRDFSNDLLNEIDRMAFRVPELGNIATPGLENRAEKVERRYRPIVIITSNSEKGLPDAFLRRCVYFDIPFPGDDQLRQIVERRIAGVQGGSALLADALRLFRDFRAERGPTSLRKKPGTAELINWLQVLRDIGLPPAQGLQRTEALSLLQQSLPALVKSREDSAVASTYLVEWVSKL